MPGCRAFFFPAPLGTVCTQQTIWRSISHVTRHLTVGLARSLRVWLRLTSVYCCCYIVISESSLHSRLVLIFLPYQSIVAHTCIWFNIHVHAHVLFQWYCDYSVRDAKIGLIGNLSFVKFWNHFTCACINSADPTEVGDSKYSHLNFLFKNK